jgi:hypothetical protein
MHARREEARAARSRGLRRLAAPGARLGADRPARTTTPDGQTRAGDPPAVRAPVGRRREHRLIEDDHSRAGARAAALEDLHRHRPADETPVERAGVERGDHLGSGRVASARKLERDVGGPGLAREGEGEDGCQQDEMWTGRKPGCRRRTLGASYRSARRLRLPSKGGIRRRPGSAPRGCPPARARGRGARSHHASSPSHGSSWCASSRAAGAPRWKPWP